MDGIAMVHSPLRNDAMKRSSLANFLTGVTSVLPYPEHLHDFVAQVVDDLDGYPPRLRVGNGREVALCRVAQASSSTSAFSVVFSDL